MARPGSPKEETIYTSAETLLQHLQEVHGVTRSQMVLFGHSVGCAVAVEMARRGFGCRLVLLSPFTSTLEISCAVYPFLRPALAVLPWLVLDKFDNRAKAEALAIPTLVIHGREDEVVPFAMGQELARLIPKAQFFPVPGMGHNDALDRESVLAEIASFAGACLRQG